MDSTIFALFFIIFLSSTRAFDPCPSLKPKSGGTDLSIIHIHGKCSPFYSPKPTSSLTTTVLNMASKDHQRLTYLSGLAAKKPLSYLPIASGQVINTGNFVVRVRIGYPNQIMYMVLDISADVSWVPCDGCTGCSSTMTFSRNKSNAYLPLDCDTDPCIAFPGHSCPKVGSSSYCVFNQSYGGDSSFVATLSQDWLLLVNEDTIPSFFFGCISVISGKSIPLQGLLGLGRGSMGLLAQSGTLYSGVFSYCLPSFRSSFFSGSLMFGPKGQPKTVKFTPLLTNPHRPSLYYVNLMGVSIGGVKVPIAPELLRLNPSNGAGTIIDSGTVITRFVPKAYDAIKKVFRNQTQGPFTSLGAFDTCFSVTHEYVAPAMKLHFTGLDFALPVENTLIHSSTGTLACLAMASSPKNVNSVLNVIANLQQQNLRILFDLGNSRVGITHEVCN